MAERNAVLIATGLLGAMLLMAFGLALRTARHAVGEQRAQQARADLAEFEGQLTKALEFTDSEGDAFRVASRALAETLPDAEVAVVVADARQDAFASLLAPTSCGVETTEHCPAFRSGAALQFANSAALDTCPVLLRGATAPCSASCVPVSVAGMQAAVVQLTGPVGAPPELDGTMPLIVRRLGDRITAMRALAQFQLEATRDPLTGLLNRRSLEDAVRRLTTDDTSTPSCTPTSTTSRC